MKTKIKILEKIIKDLRNKRDIEAKRRNAIQDKLEDVHEDEIRKLKKIIEDLEKRNELLRYRKGYIEELEKRNEKLKSHLRFIKENI